MTWQFHQSLSTPRFLQAAEDPLVRAVVDDTHLSNEEKGIQLQSLFSRAASNGDIRCVRDHDTGDPREHSSILTVKMKRELPH